MNRIVREHYPVAKLPEDLRIGLGGVEAATVTVEVPEPQAKSARSTIEVLEEARRLRQDGTIKAITSAEAVARIRALRDEWD